MMNAEMNAEIKAKETFIKILNKYGPEGLDEKLKEICQVDRSLPELEQYENVSKCIRLAHAVRDADAEAKMIQKVCPDGVIPVSVMMYDDKPVPLDVVKRAREIGQALIDLAKECE